MIKKSISQRDLQSIWHPFTPQFNMQPPIALVSGEGTLLFDDDGNAYIDGISSWWVNLHGHSNKYISSKIAVQLKKLEHAIFSGFTHEPAVELAERLLGHLPVMNKLFYSDDGSTSVEVALKMAFQFWHNSDQIKPKIIAFENAYHGDTFGAMSVGARNVFNLAFDKMLFDVIHIPVPINGEEEKSFQAMEVALLDPNVAAFIFEPLVQGAGGMIMYEAAALDQLLEKCKSKNILCIADEVMTGFGRTGKMFATDSCKIKPDIICLSKGLTGGFLPLGATLCSEKIYAAFLSSDKYKTFFHGHSYTANPIACTAALASLDLLEKENTWIRINELKDGMDRARAKFENYVHVKQARCCGTILAIEVRSNETTSYLNPLADTVNEFFIKRGVILRPLGNIIYFLPPYCITEMEFKKVIDSIDDFLVNLVEV